MTYINKEESQNIYRSQETPLLDCDPVTRDSCDPTKPDPKQNQKNKKTFEIGDRVRIKKGFFLGQTATIQSLTKSKAKVTSPAWVQPNEIAIEHLEVTK